MAMTAHTDSWEDRIGRILCTIKSNIQHPSLVNLDNSKKQGYLESLEKISQKLQDTSLKIAVLGAFGAGKSTFINAMLREKKLLKSGNEATTAAATYIRHGDNDIVVEFANSRLPLKYSEQVDQVRVDKAFKDFLRKYQADDQNSSEVKRITVTLDRDILDNEAVILDTPGFNAGNEMHQAVVERVLSEETDAGIALFSARHAGKQVDLEFIGSFIQHIKKFFFVINKADIADSEQELQEVIDHFQQKVKSHFDLDSNSRVFPIVSKFEYRDSEDEYFPRFLEFERKILEFAKTEKLFVIIPPMIEILESLLGDLLEHINEKEKQLSKEKESVKPVKKFKAFIADQKPQALKNLNAEIGHVKELLLEKIKVEINITESQLKECAGLKDSQLKEEAKKEFTRLENKIKKIFEGEFNESLKKATEQVIENFENSFLDNYDKLERLEIEVLKASEFPKPKIKISFEDDWIPLESNPTIGHIWENIIDWFAPWQKRNKIKAALLEELEKNNRRIKEALDRQLELSRLKIIERILKPFIGAYADAYVSQIDLIIEKNEAERKRIKDEIDDLTKIRTSFEDIKDELVEENTGISFLNNTINEIKDDSFKLNGNSWARIDKLLGLSKKYAYSGNLEYLYKTIDPNQRKSIMNFYLWGCLGKFLNRESSKYYFTFLNKLIENGNYGPVNNALNHLKDFDFASLAKSYQNVNYDDCEVSVRSALSSICLHNGREDISSSIYLKEIKNLLAGIKNHYESLIETWDRI